MDSNELARNEPSSGQTKQQRDKSDIASVFIVLNAFICFGIEFIFVLDLVRLIRHHAPLRYVSSAIFIQLCLGMAAITYRGIWRMLRSSGSSALDTQKLLGKVGYMVLCLLFALMCYSDFVGDATKAIQ
jgi:hypothetical protein